MPDNPSRSDEMNPRQLAYLESLGLPTGASQVQIDAFAQSLGAAQAGFLKALAAWVDTPVAGTPTLAGQTPPPAAAAGAAPSATPSQAATPAAVVRETASVPAAAAAVAAPNLADLQSQIQNAGRAERGRVAHAQTVARQLGLGDSWAQAQIDGGFSAEQINGAAVMQAAANRPSVAMPGSHVEMGVDRHGAAVGQALVDAMLARTGTPLLALD